MDDITRTSRPGISPAPAAIAPPPPAATPPTTPPSSVPAAALTADQRNDPLFPAAFLLGRFNLMRTYMPYCALMGPDPVLHRPLVFYATGLWPGATHTHIARRFYSAGLGKVRGLTVLAPPPVLSSAPAADIVRHLSFITGNCLPQSLVPLVNATVLSLNTLHISVHQRLDGVVVAVG